jgi:pimeloyl-ACP methyl ester carboxylesterase
LLWRLWSPTWHFSEETYARTAASFDNPDFVDVVVQSYRHRYGYAAGDPACEGIEAQLSAQPPITVPTIAMFGEDDGVTPLPAPGAPHSRFAGPFARRDVAGAGHNLPQEKPAVVVQATLDVLAGRIP